VNPAMLVVTNPIFMLVSWRLSGKPVSHFDTDQAGRSLNPNPTRRELREKSGQRVRRRSGALIRLAGASLEKS
jgi:hypothetical protein